MKLELSSRQERVGGSLYGKVVAELGESNRFAQPSRGDCQEVGVNSMWQRRWCQRGVQIPGWAMTEGWMLGWQCETAPGPPWQDSCLDLCEGL